jgi:hypothetical protein
VTKPTKTGQRKGSAASTVRRRVEASGDRYWKYSDFADLPPAAVATALSRLTGEGVLQRVGKGVYYRPRQTSLGPSRPAASRMVAQTLGATVHPAGLNAANVLGLSTQNPTLAEFAITASGSPKALRNSLVHSGRPLGRQGLSPEDGAILEILRDRADYSDLSPEMTVRHLKRLLSSEKRFRALAKVALEEPPRVRAILGAIGEELEMPERTLALLRESLNPLSRFDFGRLRSLRYAKRWQAK